MTSGPLFHVDELHMYCKYGFVLFRYLDEVALHHLIDALCKLSSESMELAYTNRVSLSVCQTVCLFVSPSVCVSVCLPVSVSDCLSVCASMSVCLCVNQSDCVYVCVSIRLWKDPCPNSKKVSFSQNEWVNTHNYPYPSKLRTYTGMLIWSNWISPCVHLFDGSLCDRV